MKPLAVVALALAVLCGCTSGKTTAPPEPPGPMIIRTIDDLSYVRGKYFLLQLPAEQLASGASIDFSTLRVFVDDMNGSNNYGSREGYGAIDPTRDSPRLTGFFNQLQELTDYEVTTAPLGDRFPVLVLATALSSSELLAVAYEEVQPGGARRTVGSVPACGGGDCDSLRLKLIQAPRDVYLAKAGASDEYETDYAIGPFNQVRELELKNVYDLHLSNIDLRTFHMEIRRYDVNLEESNNGVVDGADRVGYLQILGIDLFRDSGGGTPAAGPDQEVDRFTNANFLDLERGLVFFPDLRPFDPRIASRPDARPEEQFFFHSRVPNVDTTIPGPRSLVLWPPDGPNPPGYGSSVTTPYGLFTNPNVYDKRNIRPTSDRRYYIYATMEVDQIAGARPAH